MSAARDRLRGPDIALALAAVAVWGTNFVVIKVGLRDFPPLLFACLRFVFCVIPFALFIRRPDVAWRWLVLYGAFLGAGQFALLFYAMRSDITPGLASLVIQTQVFFTIALSMWLFRERMAPSAIAGIALAASGLVLIAFNIDASVTLAGLLMVLGAGFSWACGNTVVKHASRQGRRFDMLAFVVWASLFAVPPLLLLTLVLEGPATISSALATARWDAWASLAWQVVGNTLFGFAVWGWLLSRYDAAVVSPYALLVPIFGMGSSALLLGESLPAWKLTGGALVLAGIAIATLVRLSRRT